MPTEFGQSSDEQESSTIREVPPHLEANSTLRLMGHNVKELRDVEGPLENIPEDAQINNFETDELPRLFAPRHCKELDAKIRIMMALKISYNDLKRPNLKLGNELTRSNFKQPLLVEALEAMEDAIGKFRVASADGKILGVTPRPENLVKATKLLAKLGKDYQYEVLIDGLNIPVPLVWGKHNDPHQWWSLNDYEILCATYRHETEIFLRTLSPYLLKGELELDPTTPPQAPRLYPSVSGPPKKSRSVTFPAVPISSITSSVRLGAMLNKRPEKTDKKRYPPRQGWKHLKEKDNDPFADSDSPKEEISTVLSPRNRRILQAMVPTQMIARAVNLQKFLLNPLNNLQPYL